MKTRWISAAMALMVPIMQAHAGVCGFDCADGTVVAVPVPEPATLGLLLGGAGLLAALRARRGRK